MTAVTAGPDGMPPDGGRSGGGPLPVGLGALLSGADLVGRLPGFLRRPLDVDESLASLRRQQAGREGRLLEKLRHAVFARPESPYGQLFAWAGCEEGDVQKLLASEGVEGTLRQLLRAGVYVTVDEFKGRSPIRRGNREIEGGPDRLRNPLARFHVAVRSGGTRSSGTPVLIDLDFIRNCGVTTCLMLDAWGAVSPRKATWEPPGAGARFRLLKLASFGDPPARWFSQVDPAARDLPALYRWSDRSMRLGGWLAGRPLPAATYAPFDGAATICRWMQRELREGRTPWLFCFASSAVKVCQEAEREGIDLTGALFTMAGEPTTPARRARVDASGARAIPRYGSMECGPVGYGCRQASASDDVHFLDHLHGLLQAGADGGSLGLPAEALLVTALDPASPFLMINTSMGDQGALEARSCGCPMERLGWHTHLRDLRSYEKLTAATITFLDTDIIEVLEQALPATFGGSPIDYQLVEEERAEGETALRLRVDPSVGEVDEEALRETFIVELLARAPTAQVPESAARGGLNVEIERGPTLRTSAGKVQHLHLLRGG